MTPFGNSTRRSNYLILLPSATRKIRSGGPMANLPKEKTYFSEGVKRPLLNVAANTDTRYNYLSRRDEETLFD
jgi:hypothetical protein